METTEVEDSGRALRSALGTFPTGVTVITAPATSNGFVGVTANSFNSVSLDPPLVLWSLDRQSLSLGSFRESGFFAVNVLAADQSDLSVRFARRGVDKFDGLDVDIGAGGCPLLHGCVAYFQCITEKIIDGGDHVIFVGRVIEFDYDPEAPALAFHRGEYCSVEPAEDSER